MKDKYLYFKTQATDANDDATGDSACWPASSLVGMQPTADSAITLYFKSMVRGSGNEGAGDALANLDNNDTVTLNLTTANTHLAAIKAIATNILKTTTPAVIIIANNDSGGTEYLANSGIASCGTITVQVAYAN